jgi:beta-1,4-mannooligosaccharide/beta-1,4-mannosyl-N-acetylglucosamine phosphorylase
VTGQPFHRHQANPLLRGEDLPHDSLLVLNAGVARVGDRLLMAYRSDRGTWGDPDLYATDIGLAWSDDGIAWEAEPAARFDREAAIKLLAPLEPHRDLELELWRIYDPRLVVIEGYHHGETTGGGGDDGSDDAGPVVAMTFAADTTHGLRSGLAISRDGIDWRAIHLGPPDNRNQVLFPRRIGGRWVRLERPMHNYGGEAFGAGRYGIWISYSPDLIHWGDTRFLLDPSAFGFADDKVGPGAPPVETEHGWLCFVHTVANHPVGGRRGWEPTWLKTYRGAVMLLDRDDPSRVLALSPEPVLTPLVEHRYETDGFRNDVVFPTAALIEGSGDDAELRVYYGAADTTVALATASLADVLDRLAPFPYLKGPTDAPLLGGERVNTASAPDHP